MLDHASPDLIAAREQGLIALRDALFDRDRYANIENTGGYCMALVQVRWRETLTPATRTVEDMWHNGYVSNSKLVETDHGLMVKGYVEDVIVAAGEGDGTYYISRMPLSAWDGTDPEADVAIFEPQAVYGIERAVEVWTDLS